VDLPGVKALTQGGQVEVCRPAAPRPSTLPRRPPVVGRQGSDVSAAPSSNAPSHSQESAGSASSDCCATAPPADLELRELLQDIASKAHFKFRHVREAFRPLDLARDGKITPPEMRCFMRGFGWSEQTADRLFALLDEAESGEIDYSDFMSHFDAILGPLSKPAQRGVVMALEDPVLEREVNEIAGLISERLLTKHNTTREAFKALDLSNTGRITRAEMRLFFRSLNLTGEAAERFFQSLVQEGRDYVMYDDFASLFGLRGVAGRWQTIDEFRHIPRPTVLHGLR